MKPRIAIPVPHSFKPEYNQRSLPQYLHAIEAAGGEPVKVPLDASNEEIARLASTCQGVVLPGSPADVDPQKFGQVRDPHTAPADILRDNADELLLQDAYNLRKPVFGICYGLQSLNVWRTGTLAQHIQTTIEHEAGREVTVAHLAQVEPDSRLAEILKDANIPPASVPVNSSHHQAAETPGDGLRVVARCLADGVVEGMEGTDPEHFVLAVQWHPERGYDTDTASQALFSRFIAEARNHKMKPIETS